MLADEKLGRYKILEIIGAGGMGEVYLAHDEQLDRNVALKVLLPEFCSDEERVKRFKFEAKAVSALNHPSIITIHEIKQIDEKLFIATEFVDGKTLRKRIKNKDIDVYEAVTIGEQIAEALSVAHEANIVHRDVKPENIMVRNDGLSKILDFGLAKPILGNLAGDQKAAQLAETQPGLVMGSVRYMSPEQARGTETDGRTDVWSIGVVLYEMLTGENPFDGETISDSLAAVIHKEPEEVKDLPGNLGLLIEKCLRKEPDERYSSIKDVVRDLKDIRLALEHNTLEHSSSNLSETKALPKQDTSENKTLIHQTISAENEAEIHETFSNSGASGSVNSGKPKGLFAAVVGLVAILGIGGWFYAPALFGNKGSDFQSIQVSRLTDNGDAHFATVSPDGKLVAFIDTQEGESKLVVRQVASGGTVEIVPATSKSLMQPTFSRDGEFIYYTEVDKGIGTVFRVTALGGESKELLNDVDSPVSVSNDDKRLAFIRHNPNEGGDAIFIADIDGKNLEKFITTKEVNFRRFRGVLWTIEDDRLLLNGYENVQDPNPGIKIIAANLESKEITSPNEAEKLNEDGWHYAENLEILKDGSGLVFVGKEKPEDTSQIWHYSFEADDIKQITTDTSDYNSVSVSSDGGTVIATKVDRIANLSSYDTKTRESRQIIGDSRNFVGFRRTPQLPDGRILITKLTGKDINIFSIDKDGGNETQLTKDQKINLNPISTSDGKYIFFNTNRDGKYGIWRMNADGSGAIKITKPGKSRDTSVQVANDDRTLIFSRQSIDGGKAMLMKVSIDGGEVSELMPSSDESRTAPSVSPDGTKLAFLSFLYDSETSEFESNVNTVELNKDEVGKTLTKREFPLDRNFDWSADSKFLTYVKREGSDNLWNMNPTGTSDTQLTDFNTDNLLSFSWARSGNMLFIARGVMSSDLVLIRKSENS